MSVVGADSCLDSCLGHTYSWLGTNTYLPGFPAITSISLLLPNASFFPHHTLHALTIPRSTKQNTPYSKNQNVSAGNRENLYGFLAPSFSAWQRLSTHQKSNAITNLSQRHPRHLHAIFTVSSISSLLHSRTTTTRCLPRTGTVVSKRSLHHCLQPAFLWKERGRSGGIPANADPRPAAPSLAYLKGAVACHRRIGRHTALIVMDGSRLS